VDFPLRLDAPAERARVAALFERAGFREGRICRALGITNISQIGKIAPAGLDLVVALGSETLAALVRVFVFTQLVPRDELERTIDGPELAALQELDLLRPGSNNDYYSPAFVYPVAGFVIASDRHDSPDGSGIVLASDVVFPALDAGTLRFLGIIARSPVRDALDLCSGTGIAALMLSRYAEHVVAADITLRSAHFARFNAFLNGCSNVDIVVGDLYEPVAAQKFDRIVAHPPYVPALEQARVFRDGGDTGEALLQRIVAQLPLHLRPGGTLYCVSAGWDAVDGPLETRIRRWLGVGERDFDVIFAQQEEVAPERLARWLADKQAPGDRRVPALWEQHFREAGLERNVYGAIVLQRSDGGRTGTAREPITLRNRLSARTDGSSFEWALRWYEWRSRQAAAGRLSQVLLDTRPRLGRQLRARVTYAPRDEALAVTEITLQSDHPFRSSTGIELWMLQLVRGFGHGRTAREVYAAARGAGQLPEGFETDDFTTLVAMMIERGYLEVEDSLLDQWGYSKS
jgi:SAM-dependent methyltransferase